MVVRSGIPTQFQAPPDESDGWTPRVILRAGVTFVRGSGLALGADPHRTAVLPEHSLHGRGSALPAWAGGPFCRVHVLHPLAHEPGLYLLVADGVPSYLGGTPDLARTFSAIRGLLEIYPAELADASRHEDAWVNHLLALARDKHQRVDVYVHLTDEPHAVVSSRLAIAAHCAWEPIP